MNLSILFLSQILYILLSAIYFNRIPSLFSNDEQRIEISAISDNLDRLGHVFVDFISLYFYPIVFFSISILYFADILCVLGVFFVNQKLFLVGWYLDRFFHGAPGLVRNIILFKKREYLIILKSFCSVFTLCAVILLSYDLIDFNNLYVRIALLLFITTNFVISLLCARVSTISVKEVKREEVSIRKYPKKIFLYLFVYACFVLMFPTDNYLIKVLDRNVHRTNITRTIGQTALIATFWMPSKLRPYIFHIGAVILFSLCLFKSMVPLTGIYSNILLNTIGILWGFISFQKDVTIFMLLPKNMGRYAIIGYSISLLVINLTIYKLFVSVLAPFNLYVLVIVAQSVGFILNIFLSKKIKAKA